MKSENPISPVFPVKIKTWVLSTRPITLIASISPVMIGSAVASRVKPLSIWVFILCLLFALTLQLGTNWANDYFDYIKGADRDTRKGPIRALQAGFISPRQMRVAFITMLLIAAFISLPLLARIGWAFTSSMLLCLLLAALYTGGRRPLGYLGLGDLLVFIFFGFIASAMSAYAQILSFPKGIWASSLLPGSLSCAILCVNNLRDYAEDRQTGKMTLVARFGERFGKMQYAAYLLIAALSPLLLMLQSFPWTISLLWLLTPIAVKPLKIVFCQPCQLNHALELTACLLASVTILFSTILYAHL